MNFISISALAYVLNAGSILIDKILLRTSLPNPIVYTFYVSILQLLVIFLAPLGSNYTLGGPTYFALSSGIIGVFALYAFFKSLKINEASVVGPIVGALNPLLALFLGALFLNQTLTQTQYLAFFILVLGAGIITFNLWFGKIGFNRKLFWMALAGLLFGLSYVLLREAFGGLSFINGLVISRVSGGLFALFLLLPSRFRTQILMGKSGAKNLSKTTLLLLFSGQSLGALSTLLIVFAVSLAHPSLVNSLFGIQYLVILMVAVILSRKNPQLLDETLNKKVIFQKILGALILSFGLYLLGR
jgi:drug/metabolite transporter (DMT)-like permease